MELQFSGPIVNPAANTLSYGTAPAGTIVLIDSANNTLFNGTWNGATTTLTQLGAPNAMWRTTAVVMNGTSALTTGTTTAAGYGIADAGYNQQIGNFSGNGQLLVGTTNSTLGHVPP